MNKLFHTSRGGFTLLEIITVSAIISLLALIAMPSYMRSRKRSQATTVLSDLRLLNTALEQYAVEQNLLPETEVSFQDIQEYVKPGSKLQSEGVDVFGNTYGPFVVDQFPVVPPDTLASLDDVVDESFWVPYD